MPAAGGARAMILFDIRFLLRRRERRQLADIEADDNDLVILTGIEPQLLRGLQNAVQDERAEIGTFAIGKRENHWLCTEEAAQLNRAPVFIPKLRAQWKLRAELLLEPRARRDLFLQRRGECARNANEKQKKCGQQRSGERTRL